jgi:hypothetical protein
MSTVNGQGQMLAAPTENLYRSVVETANPGDEQIGFQNNTFIVPSEQNNQRLNTVLSIGRPVVISTYLDITGPEANMYYNWCGERTPEQVLADLTNGSATDDGNPVIKASDLIIPVNPSTH